MTNQDIAKLLSNSFKRFLETHSRSNKKLIVLHGQIAQDISTRLGENYQVHALGINDSKEGTICGRYINKKVDIVITHNNRPIAGVGVKFVMNNYSQNSNNYFENMLGETANIRCANIPYFQIFIIPCQMPYFDTKGSITKWESFTDHNASKYFILSRDNNEQYLHTPTKTLLYIAKLPDVDRTSITTKAQYNGYMLNAINAQEIEPTNPFVDVFNDGVILNDYEKFAVKLSHYILSI